IENIQDYYGDDMRRDLLALLEDSSVAQLPETQTVRDIVQLFRGRDVWRCILQVLEHPAVLNLPEAAGLRDKVRQIAERQGDPQKILQEIINDPFLSRIYAEKSVEATLGLEAQTTELESRGMTEEAQGLRQKIADLNETLNKQALDQQNE